MLLSLASACLLFCPRFCQVLSGFAGVLKCARFCACYVCLLFSLFCVCMFFACFRFCLSLSFLLVFAGCCLVPQTVYCWGSQCCLKCVRLGWDAVSASLVLSFSCLRSCLPSESGLGCCVRLPDFVFLLSPVLSPSLSPIWSGALCLPSWDAVSASLILSFSCLRSCLLACVSLVSGLLSQLVSHLV